MNECRINLVYNLIRQSLFRLRHIRAGSVAFGLSLRSAGGGKVSGLLHVQGEWRGYGEESTIETNAQEK